MGNINTKPQDHNQQKTTDVPELHYLGNCLHDLYLCYSRPRAYDIKKHLIRQMRIMLDGLENEVVKQQKEDRCRT